MSIRMSESVVFASAHMSIHMYLHMYLHTSIHVSTHRDVWFASAGYFELPSQAHMDSYLLCQANGFLKAEHVFFSTSRRMPTANAEDLRRSERTSRRVSPEPFLLPSDSI